ncbi:MAG: hypothetical protein IJ633_06805 [Prevotella sp.]|nr:hypothetical protein [Prevotella sp.]
MKRKLLIMLVALASLSGWAQAPVAPEFTFDGDNLTMTTTTANASIFYAISDLSDLTDQTVDNVTNALINLPNLYQQPIEIKRNAVIKAVTVVDDGGTTLSSDTTTLAYGYTLWVELSTAITRGHTVYDAANGNAAVDQTLLDNLQWAVEEGEMIYGSRGSAPYFEAEHFANQINTACDDIEAIIGTVVAIDADFDINGVLRVGGSVSMYEALEAVGGRSAVAEKITAIVWNSTVALTNSDLQGLDNPNMLIFVTDASLAPDHSNVVINGTAAEIVLTDAATGNCNWYCPQPFTAEKISYTRTFSQETQIGVSRGWETIALPFNVQTITHATKGVISPFGNNNGNYHFWLRRLTSNGLQSMQQIEANTAYLISMPNSSEYSEEYNLAGEVTFSAENADVPETSPVHDEYGNYVMTPVFERWEAQQYVYALNVGEARGGYPEGSVFEQNYRELRPFEAFTKHLTDGGSRFLSLEDLNNGNVTGLQEIEGVRGKKDDVYYDLQGRRVLYPSKGVYIQNGNKVIVK